MSNFLHVGSVIDHRNDRFATSGDHLDVRVIPKYGKNAGQHIDPALRPGLLSRIHIGDGDNRRGLTSYQMTSGFGPRDTGIKGASKNHKGQDYAIGAGNNIYVQGGKGYFSQNGVGVASINDAEGNPYELEFFHTNVGKPAEAARSEAKTKAQDFQKMREGLDTSTEEATALADSTPVVAEPPKATYGEAKPFDIRERDVRARGNYDPRYDKRE